MFLRTALLAAAVAATSLPAAAAPVTYEIDSDHTHPAIEFPHMGLSVWRGLFGKTTGTFSYDEAAKSGYVDVTIDTNSIDFAHDKMHEHATGPDWFNVAKFPTATYKGKLKYNGDKPEAVEGKLTLLGITKPVNLKLNSFVCKEHPFFKKPACGADAEGDLERGDFGLTKYTENGMGKVHLRIQVEALAK